MNATRFGQGFEVGTSKSSQMTIMLIPQRSQCTHVESLGQIEYRHGFTTLWVYQIFTLFKKYYLLSIYSLGFDPQLMLNPCHTIQFGIACLLSLCAYSDLYGSSSAKSFLQCGILSTNKKNRFRSVLASYKDYLVR